MSIVMENPITDSEPANAGALPLDDSAPAKKVKGGTVLERPSTEDGEWERWYLPPEGEPELLAKEAQLPSQTTRVTALPSSYLFAWPLWIASEGDSRDLVKMELAGRHLLKRGMDEGLIAIPILELGERRLVLTVATEEPLPTEIMPPDWKAADRFEIPARLHAGASGSDLILWREWGSIQAAFYHGRKLLWFCGMREEGLILLRRMALRLVSERILEHLPAKIRIEGMNPQVTATLAAELATIFPDAEIERVLVPPAPWWNGERRFPRKRRRASVPEPPHLMAEPFDIPPAEARMHRSSNRQRERMLKLSGVGAMVYLLLLLWMAGDYMIHHHALAKLKDGISIIDPAAKRSQKASERWNLLRPAIDPTTYPLDLLAAAASPTEGGKVRLINFNLELGHLQVSGEATDVVQAYAFIEQLKKNTSLQEYDWTSGGPQIAGKNSVKFDMDGTRHTPPQNVP